MGYAGRPQDSEYAEYYRRYVALVPDGDIVAIFATQLDDTLALLRELTEEQALHAYAPGKWSIKEVMGHVIDAERVFTYRIMRFARADPSPLQSFDENAYVPPGRFNERPIASLIAEYSAVRRASIALLAGLPNEAWTRTGVASGYEVSVRGVAWITAGHELHHRAIIADRYLPAGEVQSGLRL